jgi:hypothetical protein
MSQVAQQSAPAKASKTHARRQRVEQRVKDFEWTWTNAVTFSVAIFFFLFISTSVIPSFWLYYANAVLRWDGSSVQPLVPGVHLSGFWLTEIRDAIAMGLATVPIIIVIVVTALMQNWRRRLRGQTDARPTGGYR